MSSNDQVASEAASAERAGQNASGEGEHMPCPAEVDPEAVTLRLGRSPVTLGVQSRRGGRSRHAALGLITWRMRIHYVAALELCLGNKVD